MSKDLQAVRGMKDMLPDDSVCWQYVESACRSVAASHAYQEIRTPMLEQTALFSRSIGQETDIVSKEMYTFEDRNGDSLSLRPEGTACVVRAGIEGSLFYNQWQRLWYMGPMFRHERPQKGRYRQFNHFGVEAYGYSGPAIEAEVIAMSYHVLQKLGLMEDTVCQINHLGSADERAAYREALVVYLTPHKEALDPDSQKRLETNPLRILDSKVPSTRALLTDAPDIMDYLSEESREHLASLRLMLSAMGIETTLNPGLVRGLDYYTGVVFEWVTDSLGAQGTVCAGGRYDGLVEQLGGHPTPAFGFAAGLERLILMLQAKENYSHAPDVSVLVLEASQTAAALCFADKIRAEFSDYHVSVQLAGGSMKTQMKRADKQKARYACIPGGDGQEYDQISIRDLRSRQSHEGLSQAEAITHLK